MMARIVIYALLLISSLPMLSIANDSSNNRAGGNYNGKIVSVRATDSSKTASFIIENNYYGQSEQINIPSKNFNAIFDLITDAYVFQYNVSSWDTESGSSQLKEIHISK